MLSRRKVTLLLISLGSVYLAICLALYFLQDRLLFPGTNRPQAAQLALPAGVRVLELELSDGTRYRTAVFDAEKPRGVLAYFVGNGEDLESGVRWAANFGAYGLQTIVTEYPGYGTSDGTPSFQSILAAAERSTQWAEDWREGKDLPLFLGGHSLGSFSAMHAASVGFGSRLLLVAPPTSIAASAADRYPFLPVAWFLRHPFDNLGKAASVQIPTTIIHGDQDRIVPISMGRELAAAIADAELVVAQGEGHNSIALHRGGPLGEVLDRHFFR